MLLPILISLSLLTARGNCQANFLQFMKSDTNITKFCSLISADIQPYFDSKVLTVFAPSDAVLAGLSLAGYDPSTVVKNHMYQSTTTANVPVLGTTGNWSKYLQVKTRSMTYSSMSSLDGDIQLLMWQADGAFYTNAALLTLPNRVLGTQVYHVIDKVFLSPKQEDFLPFLRNLAGAKKLTKSLQLWEYMDRMAKTGGLPGTSKFQSRMLAFTRDSTGTVLVPTDEAWTQAVSDIEFNALMSPANLNQNRSSIEAVMSRFYIPANIHFWRNNRIDVLAGFVEDPMQRTDGLVKGFITNDGQVNIDGYLARISEPNIQIKWGVVHLIDGALYKLMSTSDFLSTKNPVFLKAVNKFPNMSQYLTGNYTILALDDSTVAKTTDNAQLQQMLLNSFVSNKEVLVPNGKPVLTAGGNFIRLRTDPSSNSYIDTLYDAAENTWIRTARVGLLNQLVGSSSISSINGSIGKLAMSCEDMFAGLNSSFYYSLLVKYKITIELGAPYTILVPSDSALLQYLSIAQGNSSSTAEPNPKVVKYVLQRMIIANRLVLQSKSKVRFQAATMNYAAMQENIGMNIVASNCTVTVPAGLEMTFSFAEGGFYCYGGAIDDASRYNLLYPVPWVLDSPSVPAQAAASALARICVEPPCGACRLLSLGGGASWARLLAVAALAAVLARCQFSSHDQF